ncbi:MAG: phosphoesterase [Acidocella sp. 20-63-7]|nr:MAG: phosphoesterase [Acidocella sp. 20-63-7]HQT46220.1 phosphoesterase [Acidocella sp.]
MTAAPIHFRSERLMLDPAGAAYWPARRVLIVADLHFETISPATHLRNPVAAAVDTKATLERLNRLLRLYHPAKVIILGHNLPSFGGTSRLAKNEKVKIEAMAREANFIWVDNGAESGSCALPGVCTDLYREGAFTFRHRAAPALGPRELEISGFHHPRASIEARAKRVSRPCFVADANRLMLPAFAGAEGGQDVREPAIARLFPRGLRVFLLGQDQLYSFALEQLGRMAEVA